MKKCVGWVPCHTYDVALKHPRFVYRVGYAWDVGQVLEELLKESGRPWLMPWSWASAAFSNRAPSASPMVGPPRMTDAVVSAVVQNHPQFERYRKERGGMVEALFDLVPKLLTVDGSLPGRVSVHERVLARTDRDVVRAYVEKRLYADWGKHEKVRRLWFKPINETEHPRSVRLPDWWEGPWRVYAKRTVKTGEWCAGWSDSDGDAEPACLVNAKTHVLCMAEHAGGSEQVALLRDDTCDWKEYVKVGRTLDEVEGVRLVEVEVNG